MRSTKRTLRYAWSGILLYCGLLVVFSYYAALTSPGNLQGTSCFQYTTTGKTKATDDDIVTTPAVQITFANSTLAHYLSSTGTVQPVTTLDPVVNPHPFNFTISNSDACTKRMVENSELFLVLLVKCRPAESYDREQVRQTWGGVEEVLGRRVLTMFLIGAVDDPSVEQLATEEDKNHHDLIQEDFKDTYYNLTYKNMMGWRWVSTYCPQTKYVMSVDVDMMINIRNLVVRLEKMPRSNFAEGLVKNLRPFRNKKSKWYISIKEYAAPTFPPFLNGGCYVVTIDVAALIFKTSAYVPFFKLDDVYVGMVLSKVGVKRHHFKFYQLSSSDKYQALKEGIGIGIPHNKHGINQMYVDVWNSVVGSKLEQDNITLPKHLFNREV